MARYTKVVTSVLPFLEVWKCNKHVFILNDLLEFTDDSFGNPPDGPISNVTVVIFSDTLVLNQSIGITPYRFVFHDLLTLKDSFGKRIAYHFSDVLFLDDYIGYPKPNFHDNLLFTDSFNLQYIKTISDFLSFDFLEQFIVSGSTLKRIDSDTLHMTDHFTYEHYERESDPPILPNPTPTPTSTHDSTVNSVYNIPFVKTQKKCDII